MSTLKQQGTKAFIWDFVGKMAIHGMGFVTSVILTRLLEPSDFGLIAIVMAIIGIAGIFTDVGLGSALIQKRRILPVHYASVFYFNITVGVLLSAITYLLAPYIAEFYETQSLVYLTQVSSILFALNAFSSVQRTKFRKELNYVLLTKTSILASLISGVVGIVLALTGFGVWALVMQSLAQSIGYNIIIWYLSPWRPEARFSFKALGQLWAFGFRMFLSGLLETIYVRLDSLIIGKLFSPAALGFFNRAKTLDKMVISYSSGSLMSVLFPILSKVQNDPKRFQRIIVKSLGSILFITFFLLGGLYLVSHELIVILFGEKWLQTVEYFKILILSGFGYPVSALLVNVLKSKGNSKAFLELEIYKKIIGGTNLAIAFTWGIEGYLYGLVIVTFLAVYLNIIFAHKEIHIPKWKMIKPIFVQIALTILSIFIVLLLNQNLALGNFEMLLVKGLEFSVLYILMNMLFKIDSFNYFIDEFRPVFAKIFIRVRK